MVVGAGFIAAAPAAGRPAVGFEWATNAPSGTTTKSHRLDPSSEYFLDYTRQSWFTVPRDTGAGNSRDRTSGPTCAPTSTR